MLRWAVSQDYDALGQVMFDAIHADPSPYSKAERRAWRDAPYCGSQWHKRLEGKDVLIAEENERPIGFLTVEPGGYIDLGYLLLHARGHGWFRRLYAEIELKAQARGYTQLSTHASLAAEGPFAAMGFVVTDRETVVLNGQSLRRAAMHKTLNDDVDEHTH